MNQHQERTAAVRHLIDEARRIEQNGVNYSTLEKIGGLLASLASRAEIVREAALRDSRPSP